MVNLLISKINDIQVTQVDESKLTVDNKKADSNKPAQSKTSPTSITNGGENTTVDLGAGAKKHTIKVFTFDKNETDTLFNVLYNERFCEITDKFIGKIKVYIDKVEITNSEKHIGKTIFNISATVQDIKKTPSTNATAQLKNTVLFMEDQIAIEADDFADVIKEVGTIDTTIDAFTNIESFVDAMLDTVDQGLQDVLNLTLVTFDYYNKIQAKTNRVKRISETLKLITSLPNAFVDLLLDISDTETAKNVALFETITSTSAIIKSIDADLSEDSQVEVDAIIKNLQSNQLLNLVTATGEMKQALTKQYKSQQEFDTQIDLCILRLESTPLSYDEIVQAQQTLKAYSNFKKLNKIIDYEIKRETPLVAIVYDLYGNLDFYDDLRTINNFADNDAIIGTIKVYDNASAN